MSELVPDIAGALGRGFQLSDMYTQGQEKRRLAEQRPEIEALRAQILAGGPGAQQAIQRLGTIAPQEAMDMQNLVKNEFAQKSVEEQAEMRRDMLDLARLNAIPDVPGKMQFLKTRIDQGGDIQDELQLYSLFQKDPNQANQLIQNNIELGVNAGIINSMELEKQKIAIREKEAELGREKEQRLAGKLSTQMQTILDKSQTSHFESSASSDKYALLADDLFKRQQEFGDIGGGVGSTFSETIKQYTGNQEAVSELRQRFNEVRLSGALKNLPPGPATDRDVKEAFRGVPPDNANAETMISFLRGLAKLEYINAEYNKLKSELIEKNQNTKGLLEEWDKRKMEIDLSKFDQGALSRTPENLPVQNVGRFTIEVIQ